MPAFSFMLLLFRLGCHLNCRILGGVILFVPLSSTLIFVVILPLFPEPLLKATYALVSMSLSSCVFSMIFLGIVRRPWVFAVKLAGLLLVYELFWGLAEVSSVVFAHCSCVLLFACVVFVRFCVFLLCSGGFLCFVSLVVFESPVGGSFDGGSLGFLPSFFHLCCS